MKEYLKKLPKEILNLIYAATDTACFDNMRAYLVGGFVRDLLLGVANLDLDIVVEGDGIKFAEHLARHLQSKLVRHRRFGTATITAKHHVKIDISSSRKEYYPHPGHLPVVSEGGLKDDLFRRDFTINAMAIDIGCEHFGELIDFFKGKSDLGSGRIRVLHDLSFIDDPTRILRAVRFEQRYDFKIEPSTLALLKKAAGLKMLESTQPQRIRDDLVLMLKEGSPLKEIRRLQGLTGLSFISPGLKLSAEDFRLLASVERQVRWFERLHVPSRALDAWFIYLMALLEGLDAKAIRKTLRNFGFSSRDEKRILTYKKVNRSAYSVLKREKVRPSQIFNILEPLSYEVILLIKAKYADRRVQKNIDEFFCSYHGTRISTSGRDLADLGLEPGPAYKKIFKKTLDAKVNGKVSTKQDELSFVKRFFK